MRNGNVMLLGGAALVLAACIPSVKPFYTDRDLIPERPLVGVWQAKDPANEQELWRFEDAGEQGYQLTVTEDGKTGKFSASPFKLGQEQFLDLVSTECEFAPSQAELVAFSIFPGHLLVRVQPADSELSLAFFDFEWLQKHLEANPGSLGHHTEGDRLLLTAETAELQKFVLKHLTEGLFGEPSRYERQAGNGPPSGPAE